MMLVMSICGCKTVPVPQVTSQAAYEESCRREFYYLPAIKNNDYELFDLSSTERESLLQSLGILDQVERAKKYSRYHKGFTDQNSPPVLFRSGDDRVLVCLLYLPISKDDVCAPNLAIFRRIGSEWKREEDVCVLPVVIVSAI